jgi:hypothetical protein
VEIKPNAPNHVIAPGYANPFKRELRENAPAIHFMLVPPVFSVDFVDGLQDDFLRTGLHRMGQHLDPYRERESTIISPFGYRNMKSLSLDFLQASPHKLELDFTITGSDKLSWSPATETLSLHYAKGFTQGWSCFLPDCRPCTVSLYRYLFPQMAYQQWINTMTDHVRMLTQETLRELEVLP